MDSFFTSQNEMNGHGHKSLVETPEGYKKCLEVISLILDGEATKEQIDYFNSSIKCCEKSMSYYNIEKCVKDVIQKKIDNKPVPQDLIDCIKSKLRG